MNEEEYNYRSTVTKDAKDVGVCVEVMSSPLKKEIDIFSSFENGRKTVIWS